jgi:hypothetical protein
MPSHVRATWKRYGVALLVTALAEVARVLYSAYLPGAAVPVGTFYLAVVVSAIYGGLGPGMVSLLLALGSGWVTPFLPDTEPAGQRVAALASFAVVAATVLALTHWLDDARRRAQRALDDARGARQQFEDVLERVSDAFITLDRDFRITYVNSEAARINNKPAEAMRGRTHWEEWPASVGSRVEVVYREAMERRTAAHFEHLYSEPPTHHVWLEIDVYPAADGGLAIFYRDITARKVAEQQLEDALRRNTEHAQELQTLLDVAPVGIAIAHDPECRVITTSPHMAAMLGTSPGANVSMSRLDRQPQPYRVFSPDGHEISPDDLPMQLSARTAGVVTDYEYDIVFDDGRRRRWLVNAAPLLHVDGSVRGVIAAHVDISARRKSEDALRRAFERLAAHVDNSPLGVVEWDAEFRVERWSPGAERILGWTAEETVGKRIDEFPMVFQDDWNDVSALMRDMQASRKPRNMNRNRNLRRDGEVITCEWYNSAIFDASGRLESVLSLVVDVTAREEAERERSRLLAITEAARVEAERANAAKDDFLAMLSHELRAPMQSVLGWVRVFERAALDPALQARAVRTIERNVRRQGQLVNDILDVSRIVTGKLAIEASDMDLSSLVEQTVEELVPEAHEKGLTVETSIAPGLHVWADHERLHQVLLNVVGNAVKFTPAGGRVSVGCAVLGDQATVTVSDTGIGIAPELITEVFHRFRQADTSSTRRHEGLGLGLSIAQHIVEQHGGAITGESAGLGAGAAFTIRLPLGGARTVARPIPSTDGAGPSLCGVTVLIVDDHPDTLEFLQFVVVGHGARAWCAASAEQALELFRSHRPDVLISDLSMPGRDGFDLLADIRAQGGAEVRAIALTGLADATSRARSLTEGFDAHLAKPVEPEVLVATILDVVRSCRGQTEGDVRRPVA